MPATATERALAGAFLRMAPEFAHSCAGTAGLILVQAGHADVAAPRLHRFGERP